MLDKQYSDQELRDCLLGTLHFDREQPSLYSLCARALDLDWQAVKNTPEGERVRDSCRTGPGRNPCRAIRPPGATQPTVSTCVTCSSALISALRASALLEALDGRYIFPARAGDPLRDPDVYPTGRGMYAFDPRLIPTPGGAGTRKTRRGKTAAAPITKNMVPIPATVAIILWGFETMKTGGDTIAMILHLLGVRIRHRAGAWVKDLEIIPLPELGRPRIDVLVSMCGIFRDTFGTHIDFINRACALAAAQDESPEDNYIRHHCQSLPAACEGEQPLRLFGPAPDQYATDLPALIETGDWQTEDQLGRAFASSMSHAYTGS